MKTTAIIVSAGQGRRFGGDIPKQYQLIGDRTVLAWTLQKFEDCEVVDNVIIVVSRDWLERVRKNVLEPISTYDDVDLRGWRQGLCL